MEGEICVHYTDRIMKIKVTVFSIASKYENNYFEHVCIYGDICLCYTERIMNTKVSVYDTASNNICFMRS